MRAITMLLAMFDHPYTSLRKERPACQSQESKHHLPNIMCELCFPVLLRPTWTSGNGQGSVETFLQGSHPNSHQTLDKGFNLCNRWTPLQNTITAQRQSVEPSPNPYTHNVTPSPKVRGLVQKRGHKDCRSPRNSVRCESVPPRNVRGYSHEVSITWLLK